MTGNIWKPHLSVRLCLLNGLDLFLGMNHCLHVMEHGAGGLLVSKAARSSV